MPGVFENHICVCGKCRLSSKEIKFVATGKKTKFILNNFSNKTVDQYIVDDCLLLSKIREEKCDYLFTINRDRTAYFIECKGSDILKAVDQLNSTLNILKAELIGYILKAKIIPTRVYSPDMRTNRFKKLRERLNGNLEIKNIVCIETI